MRRRLAAVGIAALVLFVGLAASHVFVRGAVAPQWSLDVDGAMDAIGVEPGMAVGEAGAGDGYFTFPLARRVGAKGAVYANDIDTRALERLRSRAEREGRSNVHTVVGDAADPLFPRTDLDMVVAVHAFHEFTQPVEWLQNAKKYLRPGGTVAIIDIDPERRARDRGHFMPRARILGYAKQANFEPVKNADDGNEHLFIVLRPTLAASAQGATSPNSGSGLATGTHGMVSSAHPLATEAGLEILRAGGNAFDAAVAVAAALNVVEPENSGIGGYGTIVVYDARKREARFLNPSGRIPFAVDSDAFRAPTPNYMENRRGAKAVSTPGNLHAWEALSKTYGALAWPRVLEPAVRLADDGFVLSEMGASTIAFAFDSFPPHARAIYGVNGRAPRAGERLVQKDLARSLRLIQQQGAAALYGGPLGKAVDTAMQQAGGFLAMKDLQADRAEWWKPISIRYRGLEIVSASPPANTFDFLVRLGIMSRFDVAALGHNTTPFLHRFAEATKHGFWVRLRYAGDPDVNPPPLERLLSERYWDERAKLIDLKRASAFTYPDGAPDRHTTHFVVADRWGNVVSATQTLGNSFGSRIMPEGTGIWLNNSLAYCTFEPKGNPMDAHAGRRKLSGDCPTLVMRDGRPWVAIGTPGGHTIGQTVPQMVMNLVDFHMDIAQAIAAPRISFVEPDQLAVESGVPEQVRRELQAMGHKVQVARGLGNATGLTIEYDAAGNPVRFTGAADPRGQGRAGGF